MQPPSSSLLGFLESVVYGDRKDPLAVVIRIVLTGMSMLYGFGLWLYLLPFRMGWRKKKWLSKPVISVGNITVGGTGKTPVVQYLCRGLASRGFTPAVLSYGYGGELGGRFGIVSDKAEVKLTPDVAGDEPTMLARSLPGTPVVVCKDRHRSGTTAIDELGADVLVLDDGFQVWKLHRDLEIVLLKATNPFDNGHLLPAGKLRESLWSLEHADCIIVLGECDGAVMHSTLEAVRDIVPSVYLCSGSFQPSILRFLGKETKTTPAFLAGRKVLALSSVGNPASFIETLKSMGADIVGEEPFPDHHPYSAEDIRYLNRVAEDLLVDMIVTTEKDAVKLDGTQFAIPVVVVRIELRLDDEIGFWDFVEQRIGKPVEAERDKDVAKVD